MSSRSLIFVSIIPIHVIPNLVPETHIAVPNQKLLYSFYFLETKTSNTCSARGDSHESHTNTGLNITYLFTCAVTCENQTTTLSLNFLVSKMEPMIPTILGCCENER